MSEPAALVSDVYTPSEWGQQAWFYEGIEDRQQRRALALIEAFGTPGGGDKVCFVGDQIVIAALRDPTQIECEISLVVHPLAEFVEWFAASNERDAEESTLRWIEKIVHWPDLGC